SQTFEQKEITGLAFDAGSNRLLVVGRAAGGGLIFFLSFATAQPQKIFSIWVNFIPVAVAFGGLDGDVRRVLAFDQLGGRMYVLSSLRPRLIYTPGQRLTGERERWKNRETLGE